MKWFVADKQARMRCISLTVYDRDMNIVIKEFNNYVLHAAKERIPKGARKTTYHTGMKT